MEAAVVDCYRHEPTPTVATVCARARASIGTVYHHFPNGVDEMLAAVYLDTRIQCDEDLLRELAGHRSLQAAIRAAVRLHLEWIGHHQSRAFCLLNFSPAWLGGRDRATLACAADELERQADKWYGTHVERGQARPLPHSLYWAAIFGPVRCHARGVLGRAEPADVPGELLRSSSALATSGCLGVASRRNAPAV